VFVYERGDLLLERIRIERRAVSGSFLRLITACVAIWKGMGGKGFNYFTEMSSGFEAGSCLRLVESCITQLKAQGPSRTCNESEAEGEGRRLAFRVSSCLCMVQAESGGY
jgi:hypothetical protein